MSGSEIISLVAQRQDREQFRKKNWVGTFAEYLDLGREVPKSTRNAFERVYDMIMSYGVEVYEEQRGVKRQHYKFFSDPDNDGRDAVFGIDQDGVGLGKVSPKANKQDVAKVEKVEKEIADGEISGIPTTVS